MKYLLVMLMMTFTHNLYANVVRVKKISREPQMDRSYVLTTNLPQKVVLDCQSFIQGLRIGEYEQAQVFMMDPDECMDLQDRIRKGIRRSQDYCIDVDDEVRSDYICH